MNPLPKNEDAATGDRWLPMHTAPRNASWIEVLTVNGEIHRAHFASGGGEEQPPFEGWFKESGSGSYFHEITEALVEWRPIQSPPTRAAAQADFKAEVKAACEALLKQDPQTFRETFLEAEKAAAQAGGETPRSGFDYLVSYGGGIGPDVWDSEMELSAVDIVDAAKQAVGRAEESGGWVFMVSQNDYPEPSRDALQRDLNQARNALAAAEKARERWCADYVALLASLRVMQAERDTATAALEAMTARAETAEATLASYRTHTL